MWQLEFILLSELAERWSKEMHSLSEQRLSERMWRAFWTGAFDDKQGWGFMRHDAEHAGAFVPIVRASLAHGLYIELRLYGVIEFPEDTPLDETRWQNVTPALLEAAYERLSRWRLIDYDRLGTAQRSVWINDAAIRLDALKCWCIKTKTPLPSFINEYTSVLQDSEARAPNQKNSQQEPPPQPPKSHDTFAEKKSRGRNPGDGAYDDEPLLARMAEIVRSGRSAHWAAGNVVDGDGNVQGASRKAKVTRLGKKFRKRHPRDEPQKVEPK